MAVDSTDYKSEAKILGLIPYGKGIAWIIGMIVLAVLFVLFTFEEPELYTGYFIIAGFNMCCLGVTYYMRQQLDKRVAERAKEKEANKEEKAKWDKMSEADQLKELQKLFPQLQPKDLTPEQMEMFKKQMGEKKKQK